MLTGDIVNLMNTDMSVPKARQELEKLLIRASQQEFLDFMFSLDGEPARQFIDSILDQYDSRRSQILREIALSVPEAHRDFFIHAFSRRTEDDPLG